MTFQNRADSLELHILIQALGIRHTLSDVFHYRNYRYTNVEDAMAQARRDQQLPP